MFLTQISHLLHALLLGDQLLACLLFAEQSDFRGHLLEYALAPVGELIHHLHGQFLYHLCAIRVGRLRIIISEALGHRGLRIVNGIAEGRLALLVLETRQLLILLHEEVADF